MCRLNLVIYYIHRFVRPKIAFVDIVRSCEYYLIHRKLFYKQLLFYCDLPTDYTVFVRIF